MPLPSMMYAAMPVSQSRIDPSGLADRADFLQHRGERGAGAHGLDALDAGGRAGHEADVARRNTQRLGDQPDQRGVGLALARRRPHPRLQDAAPIRQLLDAVDAVTTAARGEPDGEDDA